MLSAMNKSLINQLLSIYYVPKMELTAGEKKMKVKQPFPSISMYSNGRDNIHIYR